MKELARTAGQDGSASEAHVHDASPRPGLLPLVARVVRRLARAVSRTSGRKAGVDRETDPGTHRSAVDAGLTGGISLLTGGPTDGRRRG